MLKSKRMKALIITSIVLATCLNISIFVTSSTAEPPFCWAQVYCPDQGMMLTCYTSASGATCTNGWDTEAYVSCGGETMHCSEIVY